MLTVTASLYSDCRYCAAASTAGWNEVGALATLAAQVMLMRKGDALVDEVVVAVPVLLAVVAACCAEALIGSLQANSGASVSGFAAGGAA